MEKAFFCVCETSGVVAVGKNLDTKKGNTDNADDADADRENINYIHGEMARGATAEVGTVDKASLNIAAIGENI